jgi:nicotinic acid phosphoribosyltransferase
VPVAFGVAVPAAFGAFVASGVSAVSAVRFPARSLPAVGICAAGVSKIGARRERDEAPLPADEHETIIPAASATVKNRAGAQYFLLIFPKNPTIIATFADGVGKNQKNALRQAWKEYFRPTKIAKYL